MDEQAPGGDRHPEPGDAPDGPGTPDGADARRAGLLRDRALAFLAVVPLGTRLVVRAHHGDGARDALGTLLARDAVRCTVRTRRADLTIDLVDVVAARPVPPPPAPRDRRRAS